MPEPEFPPPRRLARNYRPDHDDDDPPPWADLPSVRPARTPRPADGGYPGVPGRHGAPRPPAPGPAGQNRPASPGELNTFKEGTIVYGITDVQTNRRWSARRVLRHRSSMRRALVALKERME